GTTALRAAIARRMSERTGVPTGVENVIVTPGGQSALFASMMTTLDPGDRAMIVDPYYATYPDTVRAASGIVVTVPARVENGFEPARADLDAAAPGCRTLLVNSPNNPTGAVYSRATIEAIAEVARAHDLWLVSDEVYAGQVHEGEHVSPRSLPGMAERTLVVGSFSKSHVMTGFRIGWLAGPAEAIARVSELTIATTYGVPGFIQDAALWALEHGQAIEEETRAIYDRRRRRALEVLEGANGIRAVTPKGAMYVMLDIRATGLSGRDFAARLLEEERIAIMPGESFGATAAGHLRVALTVEDEALAFALRRVAAFAARAMG
ncbi:MAG TPA: aminotransferase class I/II-fold pyridoxal phosphate-dependent enzyme, partial [Paracoccaceae bacterium]|nr:aminotransferase class I/II-fold pyridoxal phosphate-dependent enzyme [Paracoccaceae bacterium]